MLASLTAQAAPIGDAGQASLAEERQRGDAELDFVSLRALLAGGTPALIEKQRIYKLVGSHPLTDKTTRPFLSHAQQYVRGMGVARAIQEIAAQEGWPLQSWRGGFARLTTAENLPTNLNDIVITAAMRVMASEEQSARISPLVDRRAVLSCYAQTELGHGSNVAGILTEARFLPDDDCFEIHTPCLEACKYWPGALGLTATHAIVFARLLLPNGEDRGVHPFWAQIRHMGTLEPLPGFEAADLGPKHGFGAIDNGVARFNRLRVPRTALLARCGSVAPDGTYSPPAHPKIAYGGMLRVRVQVVLGAAVFLQRALTVAVRYSAVRRQFGASRGQVGAQHETPVLDYPAQQHRTLQYIGSALGLQAVAEQLVCWANECADRALVPGQPDVSALGSLHVLSSALKAFAMEESVEGMESCRLACGGQGYSEFSGIPQEVRDQVHLITAEGENNIMALQCARFLVKRFDNAQYAPAEPQAADGGWHDLCGVAPYHADYLTWGSDLLEYLQGVSAVCPPLSAHPLHLPAADPAARSGARSKGDTLAFSDPATMVRLLQGVTVSILSQVREEASRLVAEGEAANLQVAVGQLQTELVAAAHAHARAATLMCFNHTIVWLAGQHHGIGRGHSAVPSGAAAYTGDHGPGREDGMPMLLTAPAALHATPRVLGLLQRARDLFFARSYASSAGRLVEAGVLTPAGLSAARRTLRERVAAMRSGAVSLADSFGFSDASLGSALGRADGRAYEAMLRWAEHEPLNAAAGVAAPVDPAAGGRTLGAPPAGALVHIRTILALGADSLRRDVARATVSPDAEAELRAQIGARDLLRSTGKARL